MKPQEHDQPAAEEASEEPATALQSQEALIHLRQKMQASCAGVRPNPFLALQSKMSSQSQEKEATEAGSDPVPPHQDYTSTVIALPCAIYSAVHIHTCLLAAGSLSSQSQSTLTLLYHKVLGCTCERRRCRGIQGSEVWT